MDSFIKEQIKLGGFVGAAQINPSAGNLEYNSKKIIDCINSASEMGLDMVLFPRNALIGFDMPDFFERYPFIITEAKKWLQEIAKSCTKTSALIGFVDENKNFSFAILRSGKVDKIIKNTELIWL